MKKNIIMVILLLLIFAGCKENELKPLAGGGAPGSISNVTVENLPGGAKITYTLPDSPDLLYILAEYTSPTGEQRVVKSSSYTNFLMLDGFADTEERTVKLYAVSRAEKRSEPISITFKPLKAHLHGVFETLTAQEDFGGVSVKFSNEHEEEYVLHTLVKDEDGRWVLYDRLYSKAKTKEYAIRGLASEPTEFAFYFTDKWKNSSDTLNAQLTPLFEEQLDKAKWKHVALPTDTYEPEFDVWEISHLWDNTTGGFFYVKAGIPGLTFPNSFTVDLGQKAKFSRIKVNQLSHNDAWIFAGGAPKEFEIYGSNNPSPDGSWDNWTLLGKFESVKPSGRPLGTLTSEDVAVGKAGEDFNFPIANPAFRYIRFKTYKTWGGNPNVHISELTVWGQPVQ